ncbi:recombinase zinc beta ribbon domain-containing protein [Pectobacterium parvum]|uniref:recombinase zinc beta ribbon domain-containing protein n=1 Tax=Pectobacterium parvum TaxID=2778550 RepID=UPI00380CD1B7
MKKVAYCYCRVSQRTQRTENGGYGMTRQQNLLLRYIGEYTDTERLGYVLNPENVVYLNAEGVSGFSGKNIENGSVLMDFINDVENGRIKNAVLCIENIDRFSRTNPQKAAMLFLRLIDAGCNIHEAENEIVHHPSSDLNLISSGLIRSNRESLRKQKLSLKNWDRRFDETIKSQVALTARCPYWLDVNDGQYIAVEEHIRAIRFVFEKYNNGYGQASIRDELNKRGWLCNGQKWSAWSVHRSLNDIRLTGRHKSAREQYDGMMMYPVIISDIEFQTAQQRLKSKNRGQKINKRANNIFAGLLICGLCKKSYIGVRFDTKNKRRYARCIQAVDGHCSGTGFSYEALENAILEYVRNVEVKASIDNSNEIIKLEQELVYAINYRNEIQSDIDKQDIPDPSDRRILKNLQAKVADIELQINYLKNSESIGYEIKNISDEINEDLLNVENVELRNEFNSRLRKVIQNIYITRYSNNILNIGVHYFSNAGNDTQWLLANAHDGTVYKNMFIEGKRVVCCVGDDIVEYDGYRELYLLNDQIVSKDVVIEALSKYS